MIGAEFEEAALRVILTRERKNKLPPKGVKRLAANICLILCQHASI